MNLYMFAQLWVRTLINVQHEVQKIARSREGAPIMSPTVSEVLQPIFDRINVDGIMLGDQYKRLLAHRMWFCDGCVDTVLEGEKYSEISEEVGIDLLMKFGNYVFLEEVKFAPLLTVESFRVVGQPAVAK